MTKTQGIYMIRNVIDGTVYVGSGKVIQNRWKSHRSLLRRGKHHSPKLQRAWNRDGEQAFAFSVLEVVELEADLMDKEQKWIDVLGAHTTRGGYNCCPVAGRTLGYVPTPEHKRKAARGGKVRARPYLITFPDGRTEYIRNMTDWCKQNGGNATKFRAAAYRKPAQLYKGLWVRLAEANFEQGPPPHWKELPGFQQRAQLGGEASAKKIAKTYRVIHPNGRIEVITNMQAFGKQHGVNPHGLRRVARTPTLHTCQGFKVEYA